MAPTRRSRRTRSTDGSSRPTTRAGWNEGAANPQPSSARAPLRRVQGWRAGWGTRSRQAGRWVAEPSCGPYDSRRACTCSPWCSSSRLQPRLRPAPQATRSRAWPGSCPAASSRGTACSPISRSPNRDSAGRPAELAWGSAAAAVAESAGTRSLAYGLEAPSQVTIGLFLLGSMRVERDFQYGGRDSLPFDATPFPPRELVELIEHLGRLKPNERARHLALLGVPTIDALRARLVPRVTTQRGDTAWVVRVEQVSFDGRSHLWLALEGDARETVPTLAGTAVTIRRPAGGPVRLRVRVTTDAAAL